MTELTSEQKQHIEELCVALESGEFEQGRGHLLMIFQDGTRKLCCLGVACLKMGLEYQLEKLVSPGRDFRKGLFNGESAYLPRSAVEHYGFASNNPIIIFDGEFVGRQSYYGDICAADANDAGVPFADIARGFRRKYLS